MKWVWTWGGQSFGWIADNCLWTHYGKHVGLLQGEEIYGPDGRYLGEVLNDDRLITNMGKKSWRGGSFAPYANSTGYVPYTNYVGYVMYAGHEDFPHPDVFKR
ncbi:MAG: hypothetical protein E6Q61_10305 [Nitrosomonas sp.]|jgi:hypothetical protein|nr:MAG: hypothetical protein E6Q61_10305 [Nitrosomonas sp.]